MSCECYQIGGRFIAEDPDCRAHGREAQAEDRHREELIARALYTRDNGPDTWRQELYDEMLAYLQSL